MRNIILVLNLIISISAFAQKETYVTEYEIKYEVDYQYFVDDEERSQETLYLFTGDKASVFVNHNKAREEEIRQKMRDMMHARGRVVSFEAGIISSEFGMEFYKDFESGQIWRLMEIADRDYAFLEEDAPVEWSITNETKTYEGYEAQKATTTYAGRDYVAWFSLEIPIADGPYVFTGLPGLIVELYDVGELFKFSLLSVKKLEEPKVWTFNKRKIKIQSRAKVLNTKEKFERRESRRWFSFKDDNITRVVVNGKEMSETELNMLFRSETAREVNKIELN